MKDPDVVGLLLFALLVLAVLLMPEPPPVPCDKAALLTCVDSSYEMVMPGR